MDSLLPTTPVDTGDHSALHASKPVAPAKKKKPEDASTAPAAPTVPKLTDAEDPNTGY